MTAPVRPVPAEDSQDELAARLRLAVARLARRLRGEVEGDVSASQLSALASVSRQGPLTLSELSTAEHVQPPTMTRVVGRLEEQGLVTRSVDPADRRVARVALTPSGNRFLEQTRHRKDTYLAARLRLLEPQDQRTLARATEVLERLLEDE